MSNRVVLLTSNPRVLIVKFRVSPSRPLTTEGVPSIFCLIGRGLRPIDVGVEVEQPVVGPRVGPAGGRDLVAGVGPVDRRRGRRCAGRIRLAGLVVGIVGDVAELELVTLGRPIGALRRAGPNLDCRCLGSTLPSPSR